MAKRGNPTLYTEELNEKAYLLALAGKTDKQIAEYFSVADRTLSYWKSEHPDFLQSIKKGKDEFDSGRVENALLQRALGYEIKETIQSTDENGKVRRRGAKVITKQVLPDVGAICFWLKNRRYDRWKDKPDEVQDNNAAKALSDAISYLRGEPEKK